MKFLSNWSLRIVRKLQWSLPLGMLALLAASGSGLASQVLRLGMAAEVADLVRAPLEVRAAEAATKSRSPSGAAVLARNPFDHATGALTETPTAAAVTTDTHTDRSLDPPCSGIRAHAIVRGAAQIDSFAALSKAAGPADEKPMLRKPSQDYAGKRVAYIGSDRVWLSEGASYCQVELVVNNSTDEAKGKPRPESQGRSPSAGFDGIEKGARPNEYNIDRKTLDKVIENPAPFMQSMRILPGSSGVKVMGVNPGTLLAAIGLENGDQLKNINGFDLTNPERMLEAFARLRAAERLTMQVERKGSVVNLDYNVR
jgi:general secretion pathway protein C